jgi:hypothetical protein
MALLTCFIVKYIREYSATTNFLNDTQAYRAANLAVDREKIPENSLQETFTWNLKEKG